MSEISLPIEDTRSDVVLIWFASITGVIAILTPAPAIPTIDAATHKRRPSCGALYMTITQRQVNIAEGAEDTGMEGSFSLSTAAAERAFR